MARRCWSGWPPMSQCDSGAAFRAEPSQIWTILLELSCGKHLLDTIERIRRCARRAHELRALRSVSGHFADKIASALGIPRHFLQLSIANRIIAFLREKILHPDTKIRCPTACIANVDQLKRALADSSANPRQFRVLLFSFDSAETPSTLARYRVRENIPLGWSVGTASQTDIDTLLESIGFQYGKAGTEFSHPNLLIFLDSNLRIAKWIYGTDYSGRDVDVALKIASGESDWVGQHSEWLYALLLFAGSLLCVALAYYVLQVSALRRATSDAAGIKQRRSGSQFNRSRFWPAKKW
jgi:hypothetical protein